MLKFVAVAYGTPFRPSESSSESMAGVGAVCRDDETSPPSRAFDCSCTDWITFSENESMATNAATPSEIDDM